MARRRRGARRQGADPTVAVKPHDRGSSPTSRRYVTEGRRAFGIRIDRPSGEPSWRGRRSVHVAGAVAAGAVGLRLADDERRGDSPITPHGPARCRARAPGWDARTSSRFRRAHDAHRRGAPRAGSCVGIRPRPYRPERTPVRSGTRDGRSIRQGFREAPARRASNRRSGHHGNSTNP
jgi:hypothetical protein